MTTGARMGNKTIKPGTRVERALTVDRGAIDEAARTVELAWASELPYERYWGIEILDCSPQSIRMGRLLNGGPLLMDHESRDQVGVIESVRIGADRVGRAVVRFGKSVRADEVFQDVLDGIRKSVSVGYMIHKAQLVEMNGASEEDSTYRVTDWEPFEISMVSVPADPSVGVGRSAEFIINEGNIMTTAIEVTPNAPAVDVAKIQNEARAMEQSRVSTIIAVGEQFKLQSMAAESIRAGETVDVFRSKVMDKIATGAMPASQVDMTGKEAQRYSVLRAVRAMVDRDWTNAGFERECHTAILKRSGLSESPNNGFYVPYEVQKRDMTAGTANAGGFLVATDNMAGSFIDLLRNRAILGQVGATMLSGLTGNVTIPKQTAGGAAYWLSTEATAITEGQQTLGQLALTPKTVGAYTEVSRQLMMQSSPAADSLIMNDLAKVLALAIDLAGLEGSGASGQPTGISNTGGIGSVTGTSLAYAGILEFQTDVASANALAGNCAYVTTPAVAALLLQRQRFTSTDSPLWEGNVLDGKVSGFRSMSSLQLTAASMIFGDFSQVVIGEWGMLELALNPYANFAAAISGIRAIQTVDVGVRIAGAFSRATSIT